VGDPINLSMERRVAELEAQVRRLTANERRMGRRLATVEREVAQALGRPLRILTEAEVEAYCACCGRTGTNG